MAKKIIKSRAKRKIGVKKRVIKKIGLKRKRKFNPKPPRKFKLIA